MYFLFTVNLMMVCSGIHHGWSSPFVPLLEHGNYTFRITSEESSYLIMCPPIGCLIGAVAILTIDYVGRKKLITIATLPFIAGWILVGTASSFTTMFIGRLISGVADGMMFNVVPVYLAEIASPKSRGLITSLSLVSFCLGSLLAYIMGTYVTLTLTSFITMVFPTTLLVISFWIPESPYFYLMKGNTLKAQESLAILRGICNVGEEVNRMSKAVEEQNESKGKFLDLITVSTNRKAFFICLGTYYHFLNEIG